MSDNIISFAKAKSDADKARSDLFVSLDVYVNADSGEVWASVSNVDAGGLTGPWHQQLSDILRKLAWLSDGMAANMDDSIGEPIANIAVFEDCRISTRWNEGLVNCLDHVDWIRSQTKSGVDEIEAALQETANG